LKFEVTGKEGVTFGILWVWKVIFGF